MKNSVFVVEDDNFYGNLIIYSLKKNGIGNVKYFDSGELFLESIHKEPCVVILDINIKSISGLELIDIIKDKTPNSEVIFFSANEDVNLVKQALNKGARDYLFKSSFNVINLVRTTEKALVDCMLKRQFV